jgi:type I restriction enzyme, R subunit
MNQKKECSEKELEDLYIEPAILQSGWEKKNIKRQVSYTDGRINVRFADKIENLRGKGKIPDIILYHAPHLPLALIESKQNKFNVEYGLNQALDYTDVENGGLDIPFVYATNGDNFVEFDRFTGKQQTFPLDQFPSHEVLWQRYKEAKQLTNEQAKLLETPFYDDGRKPRYYQQIAVNRVFENVVKNQNRLLLVMATGTGKTYMASQIIYRLRKAGLKKRFLFLVDRNTLADQTINGDFREFNKVITKITDRKVEQEYEVYIALYQAVDGKEESKKIFKQFPPTFFDVIIVDECHRGSAAEDSAWREVLTHFESATQIGLTATPKETKDVSNSHYFGDPIYVYSLYRGIDDGFLAPFKVIKKSFNVDAEGYVPELGKTDKYSGALIPRRLYDTIDFDRNLVIETRTQLVAEELTKFLKLTDRFQKTVVFCKDIDHAERMRIALIAENTDLFEQNHKYVMQITSGEKGEKGRNELENFQKKDTRYPTIVTTSKLLSTGVDMPTVRCIVLDAEINSLIEFKQIIGRGTRIAEKYGKVYFTIIDFKEATHKFLDPNFDGLPAPDGDFGLPEPPTDGGEENPNPTPNPPPTPRPKYVVDEVPVSVVREQVMYYNGEGQIMTESLTEYTRQHILSHYATPEAFAEVWNTAERKSLLMKELETQGILIESIQAEMGGVWQSMDEYDLVCHLAYNAPVVLRENRAKRLQNHPIMKQYNAKAQALIKALLDKYTERGITQIEDTTDLQANPFAQMGTTVELVKLFGNKANYYAMLQQLKKALYNEAA